MAVDKVKVIGEYHETLLECLMLKLQLDAISVFEETYEDVLNEIQWKRMKADSLLIQILRWRLI